MSLVHIGKILEELLEDIQSGRLCTACWNVEAAMKRGDSVLEERFWEMMRRSDGGWHGCIDQFQIGQYRVDGIFDCDGKAVVVELDGAKYHNRAADHVRDKELLKCVDAIIRIPFAPIFRYPGAALAVLGHWFPRFERRTESSVLSLEELSEILYQVREGDYYPYESREEWLEENTQHYEVWAVEGDLAFIGSPRQFITGNTHAMSIQRGVHSQVILDRLYKQIECRPEAHSITTRRARKVA